MAHTHRLGDLQLAIMRVLWTRGQATVADVHQALAPERSLATTTVATMLRKMEDKGVVTHDQAGRQFVYRPTVQQSDVRRHMVGDLIDRLFSGDAKALVNHLVTEGQIDQRELEVIRRILNDDADMGEGKDHGH